MNIFEEVLCLDADSVGRLWPAPWTPWAEGDGVVLDRLLAAAAFVPRGDCEEDPSLKQVVPYAVFRPLGRPGVVLTYTRERGDRRLVGRTSIGVGGHVTDFDVPEGHTPASRHVVAALHRELNEELGLSVDASAFAPVPPRFLGWLNDDEDDVGRFHLGLVVLVDCLPFGLPPDLGRRDEKSWAWDSPGRLRGRSDLESWSRRIIESGVLLCEDEKGMVSAR